MLRPRQVELVGGEQGGEAAEEEVEEVVEEEGEVGGEGQGGGRAGPGGQGILKCNTNIWLSRNIFKN